MALRNRRTLVSGKKFSIFVNMKWIEVSERELPVLVTRFSCFTGIDLSQLEPDHQLYLWNKEYEMARSETLEERAKRDYTSIVEFAQFLRVFP